jgi:hypothetical protein
VSATTSLNPEGTMGAHSAWNAYFCANSYLLHVFTNSYLFFRLYGITEGSQPVLNLKIVIPKSRPLRATLLHTSPSTSNDRGVELGANRERPTTTLWVHTHPSPIAIVLHIAERTNLYSTPGQSAFELAVGADGRVVLESRQ